MNLKIHLLSAPCLLVTCLAFQALGQGTLRTITFDGPPTIPPGTDIAVTYYYEDSMTFTPINNGDQFGRMGGGREVFPENGSAFLILAAFDSLSGSKGGFWHFGLHSVDLAEFSTLYGLPKTVHFIGYRADGTTVTTDFTTDGIIDGTGPLADFETFHFDETFSDLVKFEVPSHTYALDNLVFFDVIPEPGVGNLFVAAAVAAGFRFIRRPRTPFQTR